MKKNIFLIALIGMITLFFSCNNNEPEKVNLDVSTTTINVDAAPAAKTFDITSNAKWTATVAETWVSLDPKTGEGNGTVTVNIAANDTTEARSTTIKITAGDQTKEVIIAQSGEDKVTPPAKATVSGPTSNCPEGTATVTLTAEAANATSYVWYNGTNVIADATGATYDVSASGTYYVAGVNDGGEGEKSEPHGVIISEDCGNTFDYDDLLGTYAATGKPSFLKEPGPETWNGEIAEPEDGRDFYYALIGWGGDERLGMYIDIMDGALVPDTETKVVEADGGKYVGYFTVFYIDEAAKTLYSVKNFNVRWSADAQTLDWSGKHEGNDLMMGILAVDASTGNLVGSFSDAYVNLVMTKNGAAASAKGTKIKGVKDSKTGLIRYKMFDNIEKIKHVKFDASKLTR